jgi:hypothetical protein
MLISNWLKNLVHQRVRRSCRNDSKRMSPGLSDFARRVDLLEDRLLLAGDFGDAPDTGVFICAEALPEDMKHKTRKDENDD